MQNSTTAPLQNSVDRGPRSNPIACCIDAHPNFASYKPSVSSAMTSSRSEPTSPGLGLCDLRSVNKGVDQVSSRQHTSAQTR